VKIWRGRWELASRYAGPWQSGFCIEPITVEIVEQNRDCRRFGIEDPEQSSVVHIFGEARSGQYHGLLSGQEGCYHPSVRIYPNEFGASLRRKNQHYHGQTQKKRAHVFPLLAAIEQQPGWLYCGQVALSTRDWRTGQSKTGQPGANASRNLALAPPGAKTVARFGNGHHLHRRARGARENHRCHRGRAPMANPGPKRTPGGRQRGRTHPSFR